MIPPVTAVYLAASYGRKHAIAALARILRRYGIVVTSDWHDHPQEWKTQKQWAENDIDCIEKARGILFFSEEPDSGYMTGGRHFELGWGAAHGKWLWLIGRRENAFHNLAHMNLYADVMAWIEAIIAPSMEHKEEVDALLRDCIGWRFRSALVVEEAPSFVPSDG